MYSIAICDDNAQDLQTLAALLQDYLQSHSIEATVEVFSHPDQLLQAHDRFDIYLLDMLMPMFNGIEVGHALRARNEKGHILYVTSSPDYGVDAFSVAATHYILKPYTAQQFATALERVLGSPAPKPQQLHIKSTDGGLYNLDVEDIYYIESQARVVTLYSKDTAILVNSTISTLLEDLEQLRPGQFIVPYRGYIVNLDGITSISKDKITLKCHATIPTPRRRFHALQDSYMNFLFRNKEEGLP